MKTIKASIQKTMEFLMHDFKAFDFAFFCDQVIAGLKSDVKAFIAPEIEGEWLHAQDATGKIHEINLYKIFKK